MSTSSRLHSLLLAVLALAFSLFFLASKHDPALAAVNPFAEDPYDAVSSFSVQLVLFVAALCALRTFRPYPAGTDLNQQAGMVARGQFLGLLGVAVAVLVDGIAMIRHPRMWEHTSAGKELVGLAIGFFVWASIQALLLIQAFLPNNPSKGRWSIQAGIAIFAVSIAWWYPENLRQGLPGALFTVLVGAAILFLPVRVLADAVIPTACSPQFDLIDDLASVYCAMKKRMPILADFCSGIELTAGRLAEWKIVRCLDPRVYRWNRSLRWAHRSAYGLACWR